MEGERVEGNLSPSLSRRCQQGKKREGWRKGKCENFL